MYDGYEVVMKGGGEGGEGGEGYLLNAEYFAIAFKSLTELSTSLGQTVSQGSDFCGPHG